MKGTDNKSSDDPSDRRRKKKGNSNYYFDGKVYDVYGGDCGDGENNVESDDSDY